MNTAVYAALAAFAINLIVCPFLIPVLHKLKFGQYVRSDGPETHLKKAGTPTMGGIAVIAGFAASLIFLKDGPGEIAALFIVTLCFGLIGFADDYIKVVKKRSLGLRPSQKLTAQFAVTALFVAYLYFFRENDSGVPVTQLYVPFTGAAFDAGLFYIPLVFVVFAGCVNGSNFTDGLDGLNSGVTAAIAAFLAAAAHINGSPLAAPALAMAGSLLGFMMFNSHPAKIIMGDTGSLALGGFVAAAAVMLNAPLFLPIVAVIYVAQVLSVIIQVSFFKLTHGRRVFKMAPIHHHFELSGYAETKITAAFVIITVVMCLIGYSALRIR